MAQWLPKPPCLPNPVYTRLMNQTETNVFFRALHALEDANPVDTRSADPEYLEAYDYVMDVVKDVVFGDEDVKNMYDLDNFINQADAYADDYDGEYGRGYQDAVNVCLEAVSQLIESEEV